MEEGGISEIQDDSMEIAMDGASRDEFLVNAPADIFPALSWAFDHCLVISAELDHSHNSKLAEDGGHRILDARPGADIHVTYQEWLIEKGFTPKSVSDKYLDKIRRSKHIWVSPHNKEDPYSCRDCRHGRLDELTSEYNAVVDKTSLIAREALANIERIKIHKQIVIAQFEYFHKRKRELKEGEGIAILDFSSQVTNTAEDSDLGSRALLFAIVSVTMVEGKIRYDYLLYGVDRKTKGKWPFAQCALQHYFRTCGLKRVDLFHDTYSGDFRNANNLIFYSVAKFYYGASSLF